MRRASFYGARRSWRSTRGYLDLDTEHLLWAAMQDDLVAQIVRRADGDPAAIAAQVEDEAERGGRTDVAPSLSPEAKAALLRAYDEMRELNSSSISDPSTCCWRWRGTRSRTPGVCWRASACRTRRSAEP